MIMMTKTVVVKCVVCTSENISKNGHNTTGKQVYNCNNRNCKRRTFVEDYTYNACKPAIRKQVLKWQTVQAHVRQGEYWVFLRIALQPY